MARTPGTDGEDDGTLGVELVDEFTAPGEQRELLRESRARVQSLFPVLFTVLGSLEAHCYERPEDHQVPGRIWVQLRGKLEAVRKAKEYIKGLSDPEMQTNETYPKEMHCIFTGAHGFFLNAIVRDTCASIAVLDIGTLCIKGGTEAVVMAQSKIQQFVKIFQSNGSLAPYKELEVKRRFKVFVEAYADKYTMDLLLLPSALKEELLILVSNDQSFPVPDEADLEITAVTEQADNLYACSEDEARPKTQTPVTELMCQLDSAFPVDSDSSPACIFIKQERLNSKRRGSEKENDCRKKPFSLEEVQIDGPIVKSGDGSDVPIIDLVSGNAEDPEVIIIDQEPISAEAERKILVNFFKTMGYPQDVVEKVIGDLGESEEPLKLLEEIEKRSKASTESSNHRPENSEKNYNAKDVYVVESLSRPRQEVPTVPVACPGPSDNGRFPKWSTRIAREERPEAERTSTKNVSFVARGTHGPLLGGRLVALEEPGPSKQPPVIIVKEVPVKSSNTNYPAIPSSSEKKLTPHGGQTKQDTQISGMQVFLNTIKTPYKLELKNDPGRGDLKHIIIDGSNVAMSHGLQRFFSCRGIAIAVEYFWKKGHRKITVFVPQWRTKRDPGITEQHFLQQLEELGILSFTPARTVMGSRIASHDDRFLLHLADKTGGIIVTNDNLREFVFESAVWMQIIKERLLQYTFVGDIFMLPDDPLGRHGPKLDDFLSSRLGNRQVPLIPSADSGVFFPSQNTGFSSTGLIQPIPLPPRGINPLMTNIPQPRPTVPPQRSYYETLSLKDKLIKIFPETEQREKINRVLSAHPYMRDLNALSAMILD